MAGFGEKLYFYTVGYTESFEIKSPRKIS